MLALVEPFTGQHLVDRPHLGCAMLIGACQERGIKTTLVKGQTRVLRDIFVNDSEELWHLINDLKESDLKNIRIGEYKQAVKEKGIESFRAELEGLYQYVIIDKNKDPRNYFNGLTVNKFSNLCKIFMSVYFHYLTALNYTNLKIIDRYIAEIVNSNPRYMGVSLEGEFGALSRIIRRRIKETTEIPIIVGGSLTPFINLKTADEIFKNEYFDYLVVGAGENALPSLIETLNKGEEPKGIANVFYMKKSKLIGSDLEVIRHLDNLPYPDYSQFDLDLYLAPKRILPVQTARGCSWGKCAFCSHHSTYFGNYKVFGIKKVVETIEHLKNTYHCSHVTFNDEGLPPTRAKQISEAILCSGLKDVHIDIHAKPVDGYNNDNLFGLMRKAGFSLIRWGVESGSQRVLDLMNKGTKISTVSQILRKSSENMIANLCFIMFGFPGEGQEDAEQTVEFLKKHADYIEDLLLSLFLIATNSPIEKNPEKWGVEIKENNRYLTKSGMDQDQADRFFSRFSKEKNIKGIKVTSGKLNYFFPGNNCEMLHFLSSSHGLLTNVTAAQYFINNRLKNIFPMILGEIKDKEGRTIFYPVNITESTFINQKLPHKERVLDGFEEKIFILSNGKLSAERVIETVCKDFEHEYGYEEMREKCINFLRDMFINNFALGFKKSWHE